MLLALALVLRLGWGLSRDASDEAVFRTLPDQKEYLELGRSLLNGRGLVMHDDRLDADVVAFRTPGYPMFVAACGGSVRAVRAVQAILDASTVLAIVLLARRWLSSRLSLLAGAIVAVNPLLIYFSGLILSETLFIALLAWGMLLLTSRRWWIGSIVLALSVLIRPGAIVLPALLALATQRNVLLKAIATMAITFIVLFPWAWRNHRVLDRWIWTTTNSGFTLYDGFNPEATGASDQSFVAQLAPELRAMNEAQRSDELSQRAESFMRSSPGRSAQLALIKIARTWSPMPLSREYGRNLLMKLAAIGYTLPLFALAVVGLCRRTIPCAAKAFLLLPAIYFTATAALSVGSLRYRVPADVPMAVVATFALNRREEQKV